MSERMGPFVGVASFLVNEHGQFLVGHRRSKHAQDTWGLPGGHMEWGEEPTVAAARETQEEVGLDLPLPTFIDMTSDVFEENGKHYITLFFAVPCLSNAPIRLMEPHKCYEWKWVSPDVLPTRLMKPLQNLVNKNGIRGMESLLAPYRPGLTKAA